MFLVCFYVPKTHLESTKNALFSAGAGQVGAYSHCAWQVLGQGQFMPLTGSEAFIGEVGQVAQLEEYKVEIVCPDDLIESVIKTLKEVHPYEIPAYQVFRCENF